MWTSPPCDHAVSRADKAESLPSMLRLDAPIAPVQQSHAGVHRGGNIRRTTGLCVPCVGRLLRRLRLLLHGARNDRAYHRRRRFKLETCNVAAREAARRRLFLLLACSWLALSMSCPHGPRSSPTPLRWSTLRLRAPRVSLGAEGLGRTLLRIDSIGTKLRECVLLSPPSPEAPSPARKAQEPFLPFTDCSPHQSLPLLRLCREEQGQHDASDLPLAV